MSSHILPMDFTNRPWWVKEGIDQSAHFLVAFGILTLAHLLGATFTPLACMLLGLAMGTIREATENDPVNATASLLDISFWVLGGMTFGLIFGAY